jgi:hypothetical protein
VTEQTVEIPIREFHLLVVDARAWRLLRRSPRLGEVLSALLDMPTAHGLGIRVLGDVPQKDHYENPPLSPLQIRERAERSWADFEARTSEQEAA